MADSSDASRDRHLPATAPDLLVAGTGARWQVMRIAPALARRLGVEPSTAAGQSLDVLFADVTPSLGELAREAAAGDESLTGIRLRLPGDGPPCSLEVEPGGLTDDFSRRLVAFRIREIQAEPTAAEEDFGLVGASPAMGEVRRKIRLYAGADAAVVITGETGTGKELVARALHHEGARRQGPFVAVNCSAISEELLESELFGHEKGAFTGAVRPHRGRFERADGGTLFLDEIGDMPARTQAKLLRVLETGTVERVGAETERPVDVRVVAATHVPLERAVGEGRFRADLYHRLGVLRIHVPPLRERTEDIPALVDHFLDRFARRYGRCVHRLTPEALALLRSYLWPGNVRELRNVLERVFVETGGEVIGARAFAEWVRERQDFAPGRWSVETAETGRRPALAPPYPLASDRRLLGAPAVESIEPSPHRSSRPAELDAEEIRRAYRAANGNLAGAARLLGVHRATLYRYLDRLGLSRDDLEREEH